MFSFQYTQHNVNYVVCVKNKCLQHNVNYVVNRQSGGRHLMEIISHLLAFVGGAFFGVLIICLLQAGRHQKGTDTDLWK